MKYQVRASRLSLVLLFFFLILLLNLVRMQILKGDYYRSLSEKNRLRIFYLEGARGDILDRNGEALATSRLSYNCSAVYREAKKFIRQNAEALGPILNVSPESIEANFKKQKAGAFNTVVLAEDISGQAAMAIEEQLDVLPGIVIETRPQRVYPYADAAAHVTGYCAPLTEEEFETLAGFGYRVSDWVGRDGLEKYFESYLRGEAGGRQIEVDSRGRVRRMLGVQEPQKGKDLGLTVDAKLQAHVHQLLVNEKAAVIVMDLADGGILSLNSSPSFDPNLFSTRAGRKSVGKYFTDPMAPMLNRGVQGQYPPGSIFKIVTALAALTTGKISVHSVFNCGGSLSLGGKVFNCWKEGGHGPQTLAQAFAHSCNVYFFHSSLASGAEAVMEMAKSFHLGRATGIDLPGERKGLAPTKEWKKSVLGQTWYNGDTVNLSIGQGYLQMTPAQALSMIATTATNGRIYKPHLLARIETQNMGSTHTKQINIDTGYWNAVKRGLEDVVQSDSGTGRLGGAEGLHVAGKTGTAQSGQNKNHAWFTGYAPSDKPRIAMVVFVEHGGRGGVAAASIAHDIWTWLKSAGYLT